MFDLGWAKLVIIGVVALVVIGPEKLPEVLRTIGDALTRIRRMAAEFQGQFQDAMREANLDGIQKEVQDLRNTMSGLNPLNALQSSLDETKQSLESSLSTDKKKPEEGKPVDLAPTSIHSIEAKPGDAAAPVAEAPKLSGGGGGSLADLIPPPPPPAPLDLTGAFGLPPATTAAAVDDALPQKPKRRRKSADETKSTGEDVGA